MEHNPQRTIKRMVVSSVFRCRQNNCSVSKTSTIHALRRLRTRSRKITFLLNGRDKAIYNFENKIQLNSNVPKNEHQNRNIITKMDYLRSACSAFKLYFH